MVHNATVTFPLISNDGREEKTKNLLKNIISKNKRKKKKIKINEFNLFKKMEKRIDERVRADWPPEIQNKRGNSGNIFVTFLGANGID